MGWGAGAGWGVLEREWRCGGRNCSVQSSPAVSRLSIDSVDVVQCAQQLLALQQVLTALQGGVDLAVVAGELWQGEERVGAIWGAAQQTTGQIWASERERKTEGYDSFWWLVEATVLWSLGLVFSPEGSRSMVLVAPDSEAFSFLPCSTCSSGKLPCKNHQTQMLKPSIYKYV